MWIPIINKKVLRGVIKLATFVVDYGIMVKNRSENKYLYLLLREFC